MEALRPQSDRYYLKRFEDETNLRSWLLVDLSRSMGFGSLAYDKATYAKTAAATIAYFLSLQRDAVGLITFDAAIKEFLPARFRPGHLHRLMMSLEHAPAGTGTDLAAPLEQIARTARSAAWWCSCPICSRRLKRSKRGWAICRSRGHEVVVMRGSRSGRNRFSVSGSGPVS